MEGLVNYDTREFDITSLPSETDRLLTIDASKVKMYFKYNGTMIILMKTHNQSLGVSNGQPLVVSAKSDDDGRGGLLEGANTTIREHKQVARSLVTVNESNISEFEHVQLADGSYIARIPVRLL